MGDTRPPAEEDVDTPVKGGSEAGDADADAAADADDADTQKSGGLTARPLDRDAAPKGLEECVSFFSKQGWVVFGLRQIEKLSHKYVKDNRILALVLDGQGVPHIAVQVLKEKNKLKRDIPFKAVESLVVCLAEETSGVISKSKMYYTQILFRMERGSGEKDFFFNLV